ncbi:hypothetical protein JYP46_01395 [Nitratireductor aquimarinus]|uniref:hypothetical protein n=1 Tax=Alphaproteobacteria TaxID=28211 RepID=UPI0019D32F07|nr:MULTISPECIES: hypothetical protein [Alphaproteobacteria]MBN7755465.1 hypothetical protein [Nitratireductor aquimarinus]MBY5998220.1 hypothetical protein [Tritonibacter mobilis]MBY6020248.1 hypothetical protein [Nitratireductor sp. DP7N14-4]
MTLAYMSLVGRIGSIIGMVCAAIFEADLSYVIAFGFLTLLFQRDLHRAMDKLGR